MAEIKVGEYVRTERGVIGRLKKQYTFGHGVTYPEPQEWILDVNGIEYVANEAQYETIVKHSKQLIDLVEVGDYVNGKKVEKINQYKDSKSIIALIGIIDEKDIKTILTKEQFLANCYKVGGEDE